MPRSSDNQDLPENPKTETKDNDKGTTSQKQVREDKNNFSSDNLTGKKVDADVENESERPPDVKQA